MARILVIDDDSDIRNIIQKFLSIEGHEVDTAGNGTVGLKMVGLTSYDLLITDIIMPEQDGLEVITAIRKNYPLLRTIVMTGGGARLDINNLLTTARIMGADKMLSKPLDFVKLQAVVKEVLAV
ncbi:MAG: response regulator [Desulfuromonadales bacterium]